MLFAIMLSVHFELEFRRSRSIECLTKCRAFGQVSLRSEQQDVVAQLCTMAYEIAAKIAHAFARNDNVKRCDCTPRCAYSLNTQPRIMKLGEVSLFVIGSEAMFVRRSCRKSSLPSSCNEWLILPNVIKCDARLSRHWKKYSSCERLYFRALKHKRKNCTMVSTRCLK